METAHTLIVVEGQDEMLRDMNGSRLRSSRVSYM
jgi:hypothetical protein